MQWKMKVMSNRLGDIYSYYRRELYDYYDEKEGDSLLFMLLCEYTGYSKAKIISSPDSKISESQLLKIHFGVKALKNYKPIQYIIGKSEFYGLEMIVNPQVLIPRPETEELVEFIIKDHSFKETLSILDIGTGSGCIAVSLKMNLPVSDVVGIDNSFDAIEVAVLNAEVHNLEINFQQVDILSEKDWNKLEMYDVIVSNPPYVRRLEKKEMKKNVLDYEPDSALFVEDSNPLIYYSAIIEFGKDHLNTGGTIYCEINQYLGRETLDLFEKNGFENIVIKKDFKGNDRILKAKFD